MKENQTTFPTEEVSLPSKGLIYPVDNPLSKGVVEMKYMTAKEEDILTNEAYIKKGTVIDRLLKSLIVTPINYGDLIGSTWYYAESTSDGDRGIFAGGRGGGMNSNINYRDIGTTGNASDAGDLTQARQACGATSG